jgi:hypothetical protein
MFHRLNCVRFVLFVTLSISVFTAMGNSRSIVRATNGVADVPGQAQCPKVRVTSPDTVKAGDPLMFTANVSGGDKNVSPTYNWSVSAGAISSGQGTSSITVDTTGIGGQTVTATVDLGGYDRTCSAYASASTIVDQKPEPKKITEYGAVAPAKENDSLDMFVIELQTDPTSQGYIIAYGGPTSTDAKISVATKRAKDYLVTKRGLDAKRLVIVNGGKRKTAVTELWLVPNGATPPTPKPDTEPAKTTKP